MSWCRFSRRIVGLGLLVTASTFAMAQQTDTGDIARPWAIGLALQT